MDIEKILKLESQWFKNDTDSDINQNLYSNLSLQQGKSELILQNPSYNLADAIEDLSFNFNVIDTPIVQLMEYAKHKPEFVSLDEQELFGSLRKMKMALKKQRAKNRKQKKLQYLDEIPQVNVGIPAHQEDKKRQKNRISAQISRDKKKDYISNLMRQNQELISQKKEIQKENQQLKRQIQKRVQKQQKSKPKYGIFVQTLIFIGLLFLFSVLRRENFPNQLSGELLSNVQFKEKQRKQIIKKYKPKGKSISDQLICQAFKECQARESMENENKRIPKTLAEKINEVKETFLN